MDWQEDIENSQWLEVLRPFTAVKDLYVSLNLTPRIAPALKELVGEMATEVLPTLRTLFFEMPLPSGPVQEATGQFVSARELAPFPFLSGKERTSNDRSAASSFCPIYIWYCLLSTGHSSSTTCSVKLNCECKKSAKSRVTELHRTESRTCQTRSSSVIGLAGLMSRF